MNNNTVYGRSPLEIAEDLLLSILDLPEYNVSKQDSIRYSNQRKQVNSKLKAEAEHLISKQDLLSSCEFIKSCNLLKWDYITAIR